MSDYQSSVLIYELNAQGKPQGRQLVLVGPGLPLMGSEWAMKNVVKTKWFPGNGDEASQQVLGPQELPSSWNGEWRRTMLGRSPQRYVTSDGDARSVVNPSDLRDILEDIARVGRRLRVVWMTSGPDAENTITSGRVVREGRMTELHFKPRTIWDIEWTITFEWTSREKPNLRRAFSSRASTVIGDSTAYINKLNQLIALNTLAAFQKYNPQSLTLGQIEALANYPSTLVNSLARQVQQIMSEVGQVVEIAKTAQNQPVAIANRAVNLARNTVSQLNAFNDQITGQPYEALSLKQDVASLLRASKTFGAQVDAATQAAREGLLFAQQLQQQAQAQLAGRTDPSLLANPADLEQVYLTRKGDTPEKVSRHFYGTPDHATDILRANKMSWYTPVFPTGKAIIIPALSSFSGTQTRTP